jgi:hypothetical protein
MATSAHESAHDMPSAASATRTSGKPPAAVMISRRNRAASSVGSSVASQTTSKMPVADVDHGNDAATAAAAASAARARAGRRFAISTFSCVSIFTKIDPLPVLCLILPSRSSLTGRRLGEGGRNGHAGPLSERLYL